jgi:putative hydrolase of the HAD superfamily
MATVLIDLDGTLIPRRSWSSTFADVCKQIAGAAGASAESVCARAMAISAELLRALDWRAFDWQEVFNRTARELGAGGAPDVLEALSRHLHEFTLNEGAVEAVTALKAGGYRVEVATNGHARYQLPVLRHLGIYSLVDGVRTSDAHRCPKTCAEFFRGADVIIGDNPAFDVYFPKRFGLLAVFYGDWEGEARAYLGRLGLKLSDVTPDATVRSLREAPRVVSELLRRRERPAGLPR